MMLKGDKSLYDAGEAFDSFEFETENKKLKQNQRTNMSDLEGQEVDQDRLQYTSKTEDNRASSKRDSSAMVNDVVYMDKSVMENEQPKLVVYCQEETCHVVKDICVDTRVTSENNFLFDSSLDQKKYDADIPASDYMNPSRDEEFLDVQDSWPPLEEKLLKDDCFSDCYSTGSVPTGVNDQRTETTAMLDMECSPLDSSTEKSGNNVKEVAARPLVSAPERQDENPEQTLPARSATICATTESTSLTMETEESPRTGNLETQSINFDAARSEHGNLTRREEAASTRILSSSQLGESSFSAPGPIPISGSLSIRSDSTTSARSFAFPILQSEWNSSPVRMAKADRRRQNRSWKHAFICCKF